MFVAKKFAALGAAAAISATGLVAAAGTAAHATTTAKTVTYVCDLSALGLGNQNIKTAYALPALPASLSQGTKVPSQSISATITVPAGVTTVVGAAFGGKIDGTVAGDLAFGSQKVASSLTIPQASVTPGQDSDVQATGTLAGFTASSAGAQAVKLPSVVHATFQNGALAVDCDSAAGSDLSLGSVNVAKASGASAALKAAQAKLAKDQKALAAAKKALKKAKGHKKVVLKKKVAKLNKTVKADRAKVASLSK
jgi:hypothetical protein